MEIKQSIVEPFYALQISYLSLFQSSKLFEKINELPWYQGLLRQWIDEVNIAPQSKVLEMASATGALSAYLSTHYELQAIDNSPQMIARAKEKYPDIAFEVADALNLPFENNSFDVVLASSLINVLDDKQALLDEMLRVCKDDGRIMLLFPLEGFSNSDLLKLNTDLELKGFSKIALKMWHKMAKKMRVESIKDLLSKHDVEVLSSKNYLGSMVATVEFYRKKCKKI